MIKLSHLLTEIVTDSEFNKALKQAKKETGAKDMIPSKTINMCKDVGKLKINKYDYKGKRGKARKVNSPMYQYYAYVQGWGHTKFKGSGQWTWYEDDKILQHFYHHGHHKIFEYSYLKWHVTSDLQAAQIVANLSPGDKDVEPGYYLAKDYYNSFGEYTSRNVVFDYVVTKVEAWMRDNKIETL